MANYYLGIDGGGTSCRAAVADRFGQIIGRAKSGAANILTDMDGALQHILECSEGALQDAGIALEHMSDVHTVMGLAGTDIGDHAEQLLKRLPFKNAKVELDSTIALEGALGSGDGAIAILGTGSVFVARQGTQLTRVGGWGFMVGDLGSGARIGRALLQETLLAHDKVHPSSDITDAVLSEFQNDPRRLVEFAHMSKPGAFGRFAPLVFDYAKRDDAIALGLVKGAARSIDEALDALMFEGCDRLCLLGGLSHLYLEYLSQRHKARVTSPKADAVQGAISMAIFNAPSGSGGSNA